ncbi:disease resistance protein RGA5-like [Miscanthus floridulus]|uniref:disease resistance protein RGA5-like n=1 Tax=Miscanthus floridulus TaxID=154761 RepID=UPI003459D271
MELELTVTMADASSSVERSEDECSESMGEREREQRVNEGALVLHIEARRGCVKDELETIGAFLGVAEEMPESHPKYRMVKPWADQVKDLVYDIEDCLEEHTIIRIRNSGWSQKILNNHKALRHFAEKLCVMRSRIVTVSERNKRYDDIVSTYSISSYVNIEVFLDHWQRSQFKESNQNDTNSNDMKTLVDSRIKASKASASLEEDKKGAPKVVVITGMCGSGKSDWARDIYDDKKQHYNYHACIQLHQDVNVTKVFRDMIKQLSLVPSSGEEECVAHHIRENLKETRFLIVFVGLWKLHEWFRIKMALPDLSLGGSLVIVTTEIHEVAKGCTEGPDDILNLPLLRGRKPFEFLKDEILKSENGKMSPEDRQDFQELDLYSLKDQEEPPFNTITKILRKCRGMKLAIKTVAKLLASKKPHRWVEQCERLCQSFPSMLYNSPGLEEIKRVMGGRRPCEGDDWAECSTGCKTVFAGAL